MYFSQRGCDVTVVDSYFRRNSCIELDAGILYPVSTLQDHAKIWHEKTGYEIKVLITDRTDPESMRSFFESRAQHSWAISKNYPGISGTIIHYAQQHSAPYSLVSYNSSDHQQPYARSQVDELGASVICKSQMK
jgi:UDP-sulfoquinovose synthase